MRAIVAAGAGSLLTVLGLVGCAATPSTSEAPKTFESGPVVTLENGLTILLYPIEGADRIAIESYCPRGSSTSPRE